jgi:hypothetical protein
MVIFELNIALRLTLSVTEMNKVYIITLITFLFPKAGLSGSTVGSKSSVDSGTFLVPKRLPLQIYASA